MIMKIIIIIMVYAMSEIRMDLNEFVFEEYFNIFNYNIFNDHYDVGNRDNIQQRSPRASLIKWFCEWKSLSVTTRGCWS